MRYTCDPTQRVILVLRFSQLRRPATLLPLSRLMLRVGAGFRAGLPGSGVRAFSSGSTLALPGFRASFVLRDRGHIKCQFGGVAGSLRHLAQLPSGRCGTRQGAKRRSSEYVRAPAASALTLTATVVATAAPDGAAGRRSRSETGRENVCVGQSRAAASLRSARSGLTAVG